LDTIQRTAYTSFFDRVVNSLKGVLFGLLMFVGSIPLLWWNEGRAVHTASGLIELRAKVQTVPADKATSDLKGAPVFLTGRAETSETLRDSIFDVEVPQAIRLERQVRMYQWEERVDTRTENQTGGGQREVKTYRYSKQWQSRVVKSSEFEQPDGHVNPASMPFGSTSAAAQNVKVGVYQLSRDLTDQISQSEPVPATDAMLAKLSPSERGTFHAVQGVLYQGGDPNVPQVGDVKIEFTVVRPQTVSILAATSGTQLGPWKSSHDTSVERLMAGALTAEAMILTLESENNTLTWILRVVGFVVMGFGLLLLLNPLVTIVSVIPFLGRLAEMGTFLLAFLIASVLSLTTIGLAWMAYRPVLAGALFAGAAVLLVSGYLLAGSRGKRPIGNADNLPSVSA